MEKYELEQRYDEDEIDLTELLKTVFRERFLVLIMTVIFFILSLGFYFYKENQEKSYETKVIFSDVILNKVEEINSNYKESKNIFNNIFNNCFENLVLKRMGKENYNFIFIL